MVFEYNQATIFFLTSNRYFKIWGWPKSPLLYSHTMVLVVLSCFKFIGNDFVRSYCDSCHISIHLKKSYQNG